MKLRNRTYRFLLGPALFLALALGGGCATPLDDPLLGPDAAVETTPVGGESLALSKRELERSWRDLQIFHTTLETLHYRIDRNGLYLFNAFLDDYLGQYLDPLLEREWQSQHPELVGLDANVRVMEAELFMLMRRPQQMQDVLDEIERRFAGREDLLVDYPVGQQHTLAEALEILNRRKWRG
jgi:hypothetical protein